MTREIVLALRELMGQQEVNDKTHDLAAFISISLENIFRNVEDSVIAWEKRGYWLKADRFRLDWEWCSVLGQSMREAALSEDWAAVARITARIAEKLTHVKLPARHHLGEPWVGAMKKLSSGARSGKENRNDHSP
jgi:hypothetical protein